MRIGKKQRILSGILVEMDDNKTVAKDSVFDTPMT